MTAKEVKVLEGNNQMEGTLEPINHSKFGHMDLQWFAEDPPVETPPVETPPEETPPVEPKPPEPPAKLPGWISGLTAEQQAKYGEELKDVPKVSDFFNTHIKLKEQLANSIPVPGEGATEQELAEYQQHVRKILGVPETKDGYYLKKPELPEGMGEAVNEEWFRDLALKGNLSKQQAADIYDAYYKSLADAYNGKMAERKQAREETEKKLRKEHGAQYEGKLEEAKKAANNVFGAEFIQYLDETGLGNDFRMINGLIRLSEMIGEDSLVGGRVSTPLPESSGGWSFPNTPGME